MTQQNPATAPPPGALAVATPAPASLQLAPLSGAPAPFYLTSMEDAWFLAGKLCKANLVPRALARQEDMFVILLQGQELGLSPLQAIRAIHVIDGRPSIAAALKVALALSRPAICEFFDLVKSNETEAEYITKRKGRPPVSMRYTIDQAKTAGLYDKGKDDFAKANNNWRKNPTAMLRARASGALADAVYQDIMFGLATREEIDDEAPLAAASGYSAPPTDGAPPAAAAATLQVDVLPKGGSQAAIEAKQANVAPPAQGATRTGMLAAIETSRTLADLALLVEPIKTMEKADQDALRTAYSARKRSLEFRGEAPVGAARPAVDQRTATNPTAGVQETSFPVDGAPAAGWEGGKPPQADKDAPRGARQHEDGRMSGGNEKAGEIAAPARERQPGDDDEDPSGVVIS